MTINPFLHDIPDPTDFPADFPGLRRLDSALRCTICGESFDGPVTLSCGHCFCSCCVRAALQMKQECPTCRSRANEGHIRPNPVIEEAVLAWKGARDQVLRLIKDRESARLLVNSSNEQTPRRPKRRRDDEVEDSDVEYMAGSSSRTTPSKLLLTPKKPSVKLKTKSRLGSIPSSDVEESNEDVRTGQSSGSSNGIFECPICRKKVKELNINLHIDSMCQDLVEDGRPMKRQWAEMFGKQDKDKSKKGKEKDLDSLPTDRLPKVSYDTLKDRQLRDMLQEHALPTSGDHATLQGRHQQWIMLYNANLDKSVANRKSLPELRREMKQWEQQRANRKKVQVEDPKAYEKSHEAEFQRLTEAARPNKKHKTDTPNQNVAETSCQGQQESTPPCQPSI